MQRKPGEGVWEMTAATNIDGLGRQISKKSRLFLADVLGLPGGAVGSLSTLRSLALEGQERTGPFPIMLGEMGHLLLLLLQGRPHLVDLSVGVATSLRERVIQWASEEVDERVDVVGGGREGLGVGVEGEVLAEEGLF